MKLSEFSSNFDLKDQGFDLDQILVYGKTCLLRVSWKIFDQSFSFIRSSYNKFIMDIVVKRVDCDTSIENTLKFYELFIT